MKVAVIGTGTMGIGIAQVFAQCENVDTVYFCTGRSDVKNFGAEKIKNNFEKLIKKGKIDSDMANKYIAKIKTGNKNITSDSDLLIEAISEDIALKKSVFKELDRIVGEKCVFASNTSSISIGRLSDEINHSLVGMHFFNPVPLMNLVEIVVTSKTSRDVINKARYFVELIKKTPIEVYDSPGFVVNRMIIPMINQAVEIYSEGISSLQDIDTAMKLGANHPMGPLELGDLIGLDIVLDILDVIYEETGNNKYLPHPLLKKMVAENKLGRKTKVGFYIY